MDMPEVTSLAEVWIEIAGCGSRGGYPASLPLRKCGLKCCILINPFQLFLSLPLRKCGLKSSNHPHTNLQNFVTSLAEVWIEIVYFPVITDVQTVTSLAEVWIEITCQLHQWLANLAVTSLAEVWIEIPALLHNPGKSAGHFPCGSVD